MKGSPDRTVFTDEYSTEAYSECDTSSLADSAEKVVLVTGGAGFIGSHVAEKLLNRGDKVIVIDEMNDFYDLKRKYENLDILKAAAAAANTENLEENLAVYVGDICNESLLQKIFAEHSPTHICHLAARAGVRPSIEDPLTYVKSNVLGTVTLLEIARRSGVVNFVYASSSSVYGGSENETFSEDDVVDSPVSQYAATKKSCELFASTYHSLYGLNCTGLRFFTVYGERGRPDMAPYKFIHRVLNEITIDMYGDGTSERDYTYIDDIVDGVLRAIDKPLGNEVLNLGRGEPLSLKTFISTIEKVCGRSAVVNQLPMQPGDVKRTSCNTSNARKLIGFKPKVSLETGLRRTVEWYNKAVVSE